ncbi:MAG: Flp pilus assembly protein CpaB [Acidimicrobiales bacterium]
MGSSRVRTGALLAAVILAGLGTWALTTYVRSAAASAQADQELVGVLMVAEPVRAGMGGADLADRVRRARVPAAILAQGALGSVEDLAGKVAAVDLVAGEQLVEGRLRAEGEAGSPVNLPADRMELTLSLAPERALGGRIRPGRRVSVLASFSGGPDQAARTEVVGRDVLVTAVQTPERLGFGSGIEDSEADPDPVPPGEVLITLALEPAAVERVVFASEHGGVWLAGGGGAAAGAAAPPGPSPETAASPGADSPPAASVGGERR